MRISSTLDYDIEQLKKETDWQMRMVIRYRVEQKKIAQEQLSITKDLMALVDMLRSKPCSLMEFTHEIILVSSWEEVQKGWQGRNDIRFWNFRC
jgi:hypothetical protein